jgi:hypothetical protein
LACSRLDLIAHSEDEVPGAFGGFAERLASYSDGVPVAYLTHQKNFIGMNLCG